MSRRLFITGTDTGIGKTYFSCQLLRHAAAQGQRTIALKPLASGCERGPDGLRNDDAVQLQQAASIQLPYASVNPFAFEPAIAPHLAAALSGTELSAADLARACDPAFAETADLYVIEGAGGWCVPLNETETWADVVTQMQADVILVVGMRLGCINHAMLSVEAIQHSGCHLAGWVANVWPDEMPSLQENIAYLRTHIPAALWWTQGHFTRGIGLDFA